METNNPKIRRALISLSDKSGIATFAQKLAFDFQVEILSTGGTAKVLAEAGVKVIDVAEFTGFPECFDGRVKTLHPSVHGGLLFRRDDPKHLAKAEELHIVAIDMLIVNFYPFQQTVAKPNVSDREVVENIDIGGPAMLRSAAKNHDSVAAVVDPADYEDVLAQMRQYDGATTFAMRRYLAWKAFVHTARYDSAIACYLRPNILPPNILPASLTFV